MESDGRAESSHEPPEFDDGQAASSAGTSPSAGANLRRFYGMGNAAVSGLWEFGAKYDRSFEDPYNEFDDHRFFDSRDYRCCFSLFHAKIGTFILSTLVLHEIVLGAIYLLTQLEEVDVDATHLIALLICRILQLPPMALLYVALWRHQRWLLLPFVVSQLTIGAFADVSTFMLLVGQLERFGAWPPVELDDGWRWLNVAVPLAVDAAVTIGLMWVLYRCFRFLHARRHHDRQRKADKKREHETLLLRVATPRDSELKPPDEVLIVTTEMIEPRSSSRVGTSISSDQLRPGDPPQRHQFGSSSIRTGHHLQNRHSSCQFNDYVVGLRAANPSLINAALSALVLNKVQGDENSGGVRSSALPPPPSVKLPRPAPMARRRLASEMAGAAPSPFSRASADAEFTALMLQHRNPRSSHLRGFRGSAYSLQDYLKFHMNVEKANSATPTMAETVAGTAPIRRPLSPASSAVPEAGCHSGQLSSCASSNQSLTLIESAPVVSPTAAPRDGTDSTSSASSSAIQFTVSAVQDPSGEQTPTPQTAGFSSPFGTETPEVAESKQQNDEGTSDNSKNVDRASTLENPFQNSTADLSTDTTPIAKDQPPGPLRDDTNR